VPSIVALCEDVKVDDNDDDDNAAAAADADADDDDEYDACSRRFQVSMSLFNAFFRHNFMPDGS